MGETRAIAQGLLCKIFLHCLGRLVEEEALADGHVISVWSGILDILVRLVQSGQRDIVVRLLSGANFLTNRRKLYLNR